jgi:hypothetical protein
MQNKALIYGVVAVAIVILGAGAWMVVGKGGSSMSTTTPNGTQDTATQTKNTTLKNLIGMSGSQKCTFSKVSAQMNSSGTVYVANGQMRGDFTTSAAGKTTESHMIVKDNMSYMWTSASPQGFKMSFDAVATQSDANPEPSLDPNADVEYTCSAWSADASLFAEPANVTFRDMSSLMPSSIPNMPR